MTKRERLEDLGRVSVMIESLREHELFQLYDGAPKRFEEWWETLTIEQKFKFMHDMAYGIEDVYSKVCEICCVADGDFEE